MCELIGRYMIRVTPLIITNKIKECADFYINYFNYVVVFEEDWYVHLIHKESGSELAFMIPNVKNQPKELHTAFTGQGMVYTLEVDDATFEFKRLQELDVKFILALKDEPWGQRHCIISDTAGVYIDVVEQL